MKSTETTPAENGSLADNSSPEPESHHPSSHPRSSSQQHPHKKRKIKIIYVVLMVSLLLNLYLGFKYYEWNLSSSQIGKETEALLAPELSHLSPNDFKETQKYYSTNYLPLKEKIEKEIKLLPEQKYAVFFQNLNSGAWVGINEKETFYTGSLRKIPLLVTVMYEVEEGQRQLDQKITILPEDLNKYSGPLYLQGAGKIFTIKELINYTTFYSDNTAANALLRMVTTEKVIDTMFQIGLSWKTYQDNLNDMERYPVSAKEFSRTLRSLYYSNYLSRESSQYLLNLLAHTGFDSGIPAGIPKNIPVAHKVAYFIEGKEHHDFGIIYYPRSPYILAVMTEGMSKEQANQLISRISKLVYDYINQGIGKE